MEIDEIKRLLLPNSIYQSERKNLESVYKIQNDKKTFYFYGCNHSNDINHPQNSLIENSVLNFLDKVDENIVFMIEGSDQRIKKNYTTKNESIMDNGEAGLLTYLGTQNDIEVISPEPTLKQNVSEALKHFPKEVIEYYFFARTVNQWINIDKDKEFGSYINSFLQKDKNELGWTDFEFTIEKMKKIHKKLFGVDFNLEDENFFQSVVTRASDATIVNKCSIELGNVRDAYIVREILRYWDNNYSIFIVYGSAHAKIQRPALESLLK